MEKSELVSILYLIVFFIFSIVAIQIYYYLKAKKHKNLSNEKIDELNFNTLSHIKDEKSNKGALKKYDYIYSKADMPLGRVSAFLGYHNRSIYDEEPYMFMCKKSAKYDKFREYGVIFARSGIYISKEKDKNGHEEIDEYIPLTGVVWATTYGNGIITLGFSSKLKILKIHYYDCCDIKSNLLIVNYIKSFSKNDIGIVLHQNNNLVNFEKQFEYKNKLIDSKRNNKNTEIASIPASNSEFGVMYGEVKHHMDGEHGAGYGAEYGNNTIDRLLGKNVESAAQNLDEHGRQVKNGADRLVNGVEIQTKYCKTAEETVGAAFEKKVPRYIRSDGSEKMMQIEVPRDQYDKAVELMQKRIDDGQVPNVNRGEDAHNYIRKGYFTYSQSYNIARAGNVESITVDLVSGAVCSFESAGISAVIMVAQNIWAGVTPEQAIKMSLRASFKIAGRNAAIYAITMQLTRKEIANVFTGKAFTADGISKGYKAIENPIAKASESFASRMNTSWIVKTKVGKALSIDSVTNRDVVGTSVTAIITFGPDMIHLLEGSMSKKQFAKNTVENVATIGTSAIVEAAVPGVSGLGMVAGTAVGSLVRKITDRFYEGDDKVSIRILKEEFIDQMMLANLSCDEIEKFTFFTFNDKNFGKKLKHMQSAKDQRKFAREEILEPLILGIIKEREMINNTVYNLAISDVKDITDEIEEIDS